MAFPSTLTIDFYKKPIYYILSGVTYKILDIPQTRVENIGEETSPDCVFLLINIIAKVIKPLLIACIVL